VAQLRRLHEQFPNELVIVSVHSAKFPAEKLTANIREAVMRHGIDHPVVNDADFEIWQQYAVKAWPTVMLVDPNGKIIHTQSGEILAEEFAPLIESLIQDFDSRGVLDRNPLDLRPEKMAEPVRLLQYPSKLLLGPERRLYIADTGHHRLLEIELSEDGLSGQILRVFGAGQLGFKDGPAEEAMFHDPHGMALSGETLYVADTENHAIRAIKLDSGRVRTIAGTGEKAHRRLGVGDPTATPLRSPWALWAEENILFIAMAGSHQIWVMVGEGQLGPFFGNGREALVDGTAVEASFNQPSDLSLGMGHLFVADSEASAIRAIALVGEKPQVMTLVGQGLFEFGDIDGVGGLVRLQHPTGLTFYNGLVYIVDSYNHKIKTLDPTTGELKTLIGTGLSGQADGAFSEAQLFEPEGVVAGNDRLYIADTNNHLIRIANLADQTLHTLTLRGLEQLAPSTGAAKVQRLYPQTVEPGEVQFSFNLKLAPGYKLNADAPQMVQYILDGNRASQTFSAEETPCFSLTVTEDADLDLALTLYYCETEDQRLCMIHNAQMTLPLKIHQGSRSEVQIEVQVPAE
jgi:hypothetical protein